MLVRHAENHSGRDFFVGDLHGQWHRFEAALARVDFDPGHDRLFSVGDLIDRGDDSLACLNLALKPWFFGVRGNHELLALDALAGTDDRAWALWMINGGGWALHEEPGDLRRLLEAALARLPHAREVEVAGRRIGMVHAEPPADWAGIEAADAHQLVWGRRRIARGDATPVVGIDAVVVGHTIVPEPLTLGNVHYIDTGAFRTGRLTLVEARTLL
ncbi:metallophosphoesterase [Halomonas ramblicola]|uniref:metallophosphoesterase n=1 Tax=Halomonas ramblicola TaxID=747349 RepID=UPI0025B4349D|nr:metallophosphoesterase [Halomonas ramblicola]MDN3521409.1 metallophosphoesterase [Halomonas ramblicola]